MRKFLILLAVALAAVLSTKSDVAVAADNPNQNTYNFNALNPYGATAQPSSQMHHMHHERQLVNFGISSTLWDRVFGTFRAPEEDAH